MKRCYKCKKEFKDNFIYCPYCSEELISSYKEEQIEKGIITANNFLDKMIELCKKEDLLKVREEDDEIKHHIEPKYWGWLHDDYEKQAKPCMTRIAEIIKENYNDLIKNLIIRIEPNQQCMVQINFEIICKRLCKSEYYGIYETEERLLQFSLPIYDAKPLLELADKETQNAFYEKFLKEQKEATERVEVEKRWLDEISRGVEMLKTLKNELEPKQDISKPQELENMIYKYKHWCDDCPHNDFEESCGPRFEKCEAKKAELAQKIKTLAKELNS